MPLSLLLNVSALLALVPASLFSLRSPARGGTLFWSLLLVAAAGPALYVFVSVGHAWRSDLSTALWLAVSVSLVIFLPLCRIRPVAMGLAPLLLPYLFLMALGATAARLAPAAALPAGGPTGWLTAHIAVALTTYALLTLAAITALSIFIKERALKRKRPSGGLAGLLPPVSESERLQFELLTAAAAVLFVGVVTGTALQIYEKGVAVVLDHKTVLSFGTLLVLGALLFFHARFGVRGRTAARALLVAYLLLTLAYPGVKFVAQVML